VQQHSDRSGPDTCDAHQVCWMPGARAVCASCQLGFCSGWSLSCPSSGCQDTCLWGHALRLWLRQDHCHVVYHAQAVASASARAWASCSPPLLQCPLLQMGAPLQDIMHAAPAPLQDIMHAAPAPLQDIMHAAPAPLQDIIHAAPAPLQDIMHAAPALCTQAIAQAQRDVAASQHRTCLLHTAAH
jgi:hypothetical protein